MENKKILLESEKLDCYMELGHTECAKCHKHIDEWDSFTLVHLPSIDQDNNTIYCSDCFDNSKLYLV